MNKNELIEVIEPLLIGFSYDRERKLRKAVEITDALLSRFPELSYPCVFKTPDNFQIKLHKMHRFESPFTGNQYEYCAFNCKTKNPHVRNAKE